MKKRKPLKPVTGHPQCYSNSSHTLWWEGAFKGILSSGERKRCGVGTRQAACRMAVNSYLITPNFAGIL
jgi:hypothetical protein